MSGWKLNERQRDALAECQRVTERKCLYWWREASCRQLAALGLMEQWTPPSIAERPRLKRRPYRITDAGRAALAAADGEQASISTTQLGGNRHS